MTDHSKISVRVTHTLYSMWRLPILYSVWGLTILIYTLTQCVRITNTYIHTVCEDHQYLYIHSIWGLPILIHSVGGLPKLTILTHIIHFRICSIYLLIRHSNIISSQSVTRQRLTKELEVKLQLLAYRTKGNRKILGWLLYCYNIWRRTVFGFVHPISEMNKYIHFFATLLICKNGQQRGY